jgi:hypothetical protein
MASRPRRTTKKDEKFFAALAETCVVTYACKLAGYARRSVYEWREADKKFRAKWDDAIEQGIDVLERAAYERAVQGVEVPVFDKGEIVGTTTKYSDTLLIFLMKGRRPERYRDNHTVEHTGPEGGPVQSTVTVNFIKAEDSD